MEKQGWPLSYNDVLRLTDRFSGKAMNITMVYKTIERLMERNMLAPSEQVDSGGKRSRTYTIHGSGREAFRLAVLNSRLLAGSQSPAAA
jgi:DNA-binding PadR family transcriptional regulator